MNGFKFKFSFKIVVNENDVPTAVTEILLVSVPRKDIRLVRHHFSRNKHYA